MNDAEQIEYFDRQRDWVQEHLGDIRKVYSGRCIAVYNQQIIDSDSNEVTLARRIDLRRKELGDLVDPVLTLDPSTFNRNAISHEESPEGAPQNIE